MATKYYFLAPMPPLNERPKTIKCVGDDGAISFIPMDERNQQYREYMDWTSAGGVTEQDHPG